MDLKLTDLLMVYRLPFAKYIKEFPDEKDLLFVLLGLGH